MKKIASAVAALALTAGGALAGGIDRTTMPYSILFEKGRVAQLSFSTAIPNVSGALTVAPGVSIGTGNMSQNYASVGLAYKADLTDKLSYAIILNSPYGADAKYPSLYTGLQANWGSSQIAGILKYKIADRVSVYGGVKHVTSSATIAIPDSLIRGGLRAAGAAGNPRAAALAALAPTGTLAYTAKGENDSKVAFIIGAAYEIPDIALRVGLSYESGFTHEFKTTEFIAAVPSVSGVGTTKVEMPQSVTLDFQSGVAKDTLVFGSIRWAEWSVWEVRPQGYNALTGSDITSFDNNVLTYQLGVGRKINDNLSLFARVGYEKANGGEASRLAPTDGSRSIGIGGSWTNGKLKVTGGVEYVKLGDAVDGSGTRFESNDALGIGLSVAMTF
ncbi:MAG: outer membrane protein transport protein [Paracoccaceae bacterium]